MDEIFFSFDSRKNVVEKNLDQSCSDMVELLEMSGRFYLGFILLPTSSNYFEIHMLQVIPEKSVSI